MTSDIERRIAELELRIDANADRSSTSRRWDCSSHRRFTARHFFDARGSCEQLS